MQVNFEESVSSEDLSKRKSHFRKIHGLLSTNPKVPEIIPTGHYRRAREAQISNRTSQKLNNKSEKASQKMVDQMASFENAVQLICLPQKMELHPKGMRPIEAKEFETFKQ